MNERYTIDQLCERTGCTRRTIRFYVNEGLIDPPAGRGRGGFYNDSTLQKLLQIKEMRGKGMRLADIARFLKASEMKPDRVPAEPQGQDWIRYAVLPGFEIHIARELGESGRMAAAQVIRVARALLDKGAKHDD